MLRNMVKGLPKLQVEHEGVCIGCALRKSAKGYFPSSYSRYNGILDLVHSNICGPMIISYINGFLYYVKFIDDFSKKTWKYFTKTKDEILNRF